jgi:glucose/arabinose dehydrogenase
MRGLRPALAMSLLGLLLCSCYAVRPSHGGGQSVSSNDRRVNPADVILPPGYRIEAVATNLTYPTGVTFDSSGNVYVVEAGYSYGEDFRRPRLLRVGIGGIVSTVVDGDNGPWTGAVFHDNAFYIAEGGAERGGAILKVTPDGKKTELVSGLPSVGDHHTNGPAIGPDGKIYFGIGVATNSGVVGIDNYQFGWLKRHRDFHDIPARDITLAGENFTTKSPFEGENKKEVVTGAYLPYGTPSEKGQIIKGQLPCTGAILRIAPTGGAPELVAWGLRNPFGLCFGMDGALYVTENGYDVRGSRPVFGAGDCLWKIPTTGEAPWFGWPDYFAGELISNPDRFQAPFQPAPKPLLSSHPMEPPKPLAIFAVHSSADGFDFSRGGAFGYPGEAFVAEFGDMAPGVGKTLAPVGFKVVRVDPTTGVIHDFAANPGHNTAPASKLNTGGLERPVACRFNPAGTALYVVDFGVLTMSGTKSHPRPGTGVLWKITREGRP